MSEQAMIPLVAVSNAAELWRRLPEALAGQFALFPQPVGQAAPDDLPTEVPAGTAVVIQTSGSTATPKRVVLSGSALLAGAQASADRIGSGRWVLPLPLHYIAGFQILVRSLVAGTEPVIIQKFSLEAFFDAVAETAGDEGLYTSLVPNQLLRLVEVAEGDDFLASSRRSLLQKFAAILVGGQALTAAIAERAERIGLNIVTTYGASETAGGCVYDGAPLNGVQLNIRDGLLEIAGPMLASGYLLDAQRTAATFVDRDGVVWYQAADRAEIVEGRVKIMGREDDIFICGGVKVSLSEVTEVVKSLPGLAAAEVVAMPDGRWGTVAVVAVDGRNRMRRLTLEEIQSAVREKLGEAAGPRQLIYFDEGLPLLDSGKTDIHRLRQLISEEPRERS